MHILASGRKALIILALITLSPAILAPLQNCQLDKRGGDSRIGPEHGKKDPTYDPDKHTKTKEEITRPNKKNAQSGLKAGMADDNKQFNYYLKFLKKYKSAQHLKLDVSERIRLFLKDAEGKTIPNALVQIFPGKSKRAISKGVTFADGSYYFYPSLHDHKTEEYRAEFRYKNQTRKLNFSRKGKRQIELTWKNKRSIPLGIPADILFIIDTTGSMGEEIHRLKETIEIIHDNLTAITPRPRIRFGLSLYRDKEDDYRTKLIPLTEDLETFRRELDKVEAGGGGDLPEDLQAALEDSVKKVRWNPEGVRMAFIITDAPPHLDYGQKYTYIKAARDARAKGIKFFSVGTGGLNLQGEYVLRQLAQFTQGAYIFLTYGEKGESGGGAPGSVSHHTGSNFVTDKLESIIIRLAKTEISHLSRVSVAKNTEYFDANKIPQESEEETVKKLFNQALAQLVDYSTINIKTGSPTGVLPLETGTGVKPEQSAFFTENLELALSRNKNFKVVERNRMRKVVQEISLQASGMTDEEGAARIGKMTNAEYLLMGKIYIEREKYSLFLRLVRVETGEVLSVTRARMDTRLGYK